MDCDILKKVAGLIRDELMSSKNKVKSSKSSARSESPIDVDGINNNMEGDHSQEKVKSTKKKKRKLSSTTTSNKHSAEGGKKRRSVPAMAFHPPDSLELRMNHPGGKGLASSMIDIVECYRTILKKNILITQDMKKGGSKQLPVQFVEYPFSPSTHTEIDTVLNKSEV